MIKQTTCYVCNRKLTGKKEDTEWHHVVPQANGGKDGLVVPLCNDHHDKVHNMATEALAAIRQNNDRIDHIAYPWIVSPKQESNREEYLASVIVRSTLLVKNDPNKRSKLTINLTGQEARHLDVAKKVFNVNSREAVVKLALQKLYQLANIKNHA